MTCRKGPTRRCLCLFVRGGTKSHKHRAPLMCKGGVRPCPRPFSVVRGGRPGARVVRVSFLWRVCLCLVGLCVSGRGGRGCVGVVRLALFVFGSGGLRGALLPLLSPWFSVVFFLGVVSCGSCGCLSLLVSGGVCSSGCRSCGLGLFLLGLFPADWSVSLSVPTASP